MAAILERIAGLPVTREDLARLGILSLLDKYPELGYYLFRAYARGQPDLFPGYTYFGVIGPEGMPKIVNRRPVPWKGKKFGKHPDLRLPPGTPPGVLEGLKKAIEISKKAAGTRGVAAVPIKGGRTVVLPCKAFVQMTYSDYSEKAAVATEIYEAAKKGSTVAEVLPRITLIRPKTALGIPRIPRGRR